MRPAIRVANARGCRGRCLHHVRHKASRGASNFSASAGEAFLYSLCQGSSAGPVTVRKCRRTLLRPRQ
ncbi:hypothetical protein NK6_7208 [Bradyrhizobium diazoefficiens]|uniref:Uncharacterized protein n=1 Tax=Bradyrhizobium diazoefficiens TaxID=1355477 RepID=A0A0E4FWP0_9BRAD|nr:hypothetical protein NK6_7208 [Bradyrhizobium diazoefficiens]